MRVFLLSLGRFRTTTPVRRQNWPPLSSYLNLHHLSPSFSSLIIVGLVLDNADELLEVEAFELLEVLLVLLRLRSVKFDDAADNLNTGLHIIHRLGEERNEVVVLHLAENTVVAGDLQLGALNPKLKICDLGLELGELEVDDGGLAEVDRPLDEGRVWGQVVATGLFIPLRLIIGSIS